MLVISAPARFTPGLIGHERNYVLSRKNQFVVKHPARPLLPFFFYPPTKAAEVVVQVWHPH